MAKTSSTFALNILDFPQFNDFAIDLQFPGDSPIVLPCFSYDLRGIDHLFPRFSLKTQQKGYFSIFFHPKNVFCPVSWELRTNIAVKEPGTHWLILASSGNSPSLRENPRRYSLVVTGPCFFAIHGPVEMTFSFSQWKNGDKNPLKLWKNITAENGYCLTLTILTGPFSIAM